MVDQYLKKKMPEKVENGPEYDKLKEFMCMLVYPEHYARTLQDEQMT